MAPKKEWIFAPKVSDLYHDSEKRIFLQKQGNC